MNCHQKEEFQLMQNHYVPPCHNCFYNAKWVSTKLLNGQNLLSMTKVIYQWFMHMVVIYCKIFLLHPGRIILSLKLMYNLEALQISKIVCELTIGCCLCIYQTLFETSHSLLSNWNYLLLGINWFNFASD